MTRLHIMLLPLLVAGGCQSQESATCSSIEVVQGPSPTTHRALEMRALKATLPIAPADRNADHLELLTPPELSIVADGYTYALWLDRTTDEIWLVELGGLAGMWTWRGPMDADHPIVTLILGAR